MRGSAVLLIPLISISFACKKASDADAIPPTSGSGSASVVIPKAKIDQVTPPFDLKNPPADATRTASGLVFKKIVTNDAGAAPHRNDTVKVTFTGWKQSTGETFFTNSKRDQPMPLNLSTAAAGFTEGMQLLKKGETAMVWMPPQIGYKGKPPATPETLVYQIQLLDITPAPAIPSDLTSPPATAQTTKSGTKYVVLKPGTGTDKIEPDDVLTFNYSAWDTEGRMFDTTETTHKPSNGSAGHQAIALQEVLQQMTTGERVRMWTTSDKMTVDKKPAPGMPEGALCYEIELASFVHALPPWKTPPDVAKAPDDAKKTASGLAYKVLKTGKGGDHPTATSTVSAYYSGWTTDGKSFDSTVVPRDFPLTGVIKGWTEGLQLMAVGDRYRFWIPVELAYNNQPGKPAGMLVFDIELAGIKAGGPHAPPPSPMPPGHPGGPPPGAPRGAQPPPGHPGAPPPPPPHP